jgi:hypothetical protein
MNRRALELHMVRSRRQGPRGYCGLVTGLVRGRERAREGRGGERAEVESGCTKICWVARETCI